MTAAAAGLSLREDVLTVQVGGEILALPAADIAEIVRPSAWTRVPNGPPSLLGVVNLRGVVLPVVSLASLLGHARLPEAASSRIVVLAGAALVGLLVDTVSGLGKGVGGRMLDVRTLLSLEFGAMLRRGAARPDGKRPNLPQTERAADRDRLAVIGVRLADQEYALPLDKVVEVLRLPPALAALPRTDDAMLGLTAFRGGLLPLVSLRALVGLPAPVLSGAARVVVAVIGAAPVGLVVDAVTATLDIPAAAIDPVPPVLVRGAGEAQIEGICRLEGGRRLICLLSPTRLFDPETAARVQAQSKQEATPMPGSATSGAVEQFVIFRLGDEQYGLPIAAVDEVVRCPDAVTRLPHAPDFVEGVISLRGRVVPLIDAGRRFGTHVQSALSRRVVVVTMDGLQAGFVVDSVSEVLGVPVAELRPAPEFDATEAPLFDRVAVERHGRMILLISPSGLLRQAERDLLAPITEAAAPPP